MSDELEEIRQQKLEALRNGERQTDESPDSEQSPDEPVHITSLNEFQDAVDSGVVLVDFYADWCGPCKQLEPIVERIAAGTEATVAKVDIDANQQLAAQYAVRSVPTLLLFVGGEQVEQLVGITQESRLRSLIERYS
jgi:thioredoxin 1